MSSFVQHFSDGSLYGCLDDFFGPHEYGYIKLESIDQWYNLSEVHDWKKQVMTGENFLKKTKGLTRVHGQAPKVEEVKENKELLDIDKKLSEKFIRDYVACTPCEMGKPNSILEKLREDLEERIKEYKGKLSTKKITKQTTQDKILLIRINELEVVLIVLTSLSSEEQPEDPKGKIYREWVEKEKKHFFEQYKDLLPEEQPQFTPGQEEQVTIPEYKPPASIIYPNVGMEDIAMELSKGLIHLYELTHFLHSQFPNSKPK